MRKVLLYFILLMALLLAGTVAYVSIKGLLLVFSGVGLLGLIFFTTIEISKIVATSTLHTYSDKLNFLYKSMLTLCVGIAMVITSIGVYGFLSSNYQNTANKLGISKSEIGLVENKKTLLIGSIEKIQEQIDFKTNQGAKLIELRTQQENRLDSLYNRNQIRNARTVQDIISETNGDLKVIEGDINKLYTEMSAINDSIIKLDMSILELNSNNELSSELGPLMYLAEITNSDMDSVIKWFILLLIIIGDPMAVLLIIIFTKIINDEPKKSKSQIIHNKKDDPIGLGGPDESTSTEKEVTSELSKQSNEENKIEVLEKAVNLSNDVKKNREPITINDIPEKKNRGFSVEVPNPEKVNKQQISRIGSNKEVRSEDINRVFFKKNDRR
jgi:hypothetical protein